MRDKQAWSDQSPHTDGDSMTRKHERGDRNIAPRDSTYGCRKCGTYARLKKGDALNCRHCRFPGTLIDVVDAVCSPADDMPARPQPTQAKGTP